jgi:hypothetical protein
MPSEDGCWHGPNVPKTPLQVACCWIRAVAHVEDMLRRAVEFSENPHGGRIKKYVVCPKDEGVARADKDENHAWFPDLNPTSARSSPSAATAKHGTPSAKSLSRRTATRPTPTAASALNKDQHPHQGHQHIIEFPDFKPDCAHLIPRAEYPAWYVDMLDEIDAHTEDMRGAPWLNFQTIFRRELTFQDIL